MNDTNYVQTYGGTLEVRPNPFNIINISKPVVLNSGGPLMTIEKVTFSGESTDCLCSWKDEAGFVQRETFAVETLSHLVPVAKSAGHCFITKGQ